MEKHPAETNYHYTRPTLVQKAVYVAIGVTAALAIHSCSPRTFDKMARTYEYAQSEAARLKDRVIDGVK